VIEFRGVTKRFPDGTVAVDNLELQVRDGGITVFVGPSGCGKTTSLRMVNRMIDPSSGTILVNGTDVMKTDAAQLRRGIGYVIQQAGLFPHRTIVDNVATVPLLLGWSKKKARDRAMELMETVGLTPEMARRYPGQLSGGQQQRVGVARALAADPPVLLMDEPFSAGRPRRAREPAGPSCSSCRPTWARRSCSSPTTSTRPSSSVIGSRCSGSAASWPSTTSPACCSPGRPTTSWTPSSGATAATAACRSAPRSGLPLHELRTARSGERTEQGWSLVLDADGRPLGWHHDRRPAAAPRTRTISSPAGRSTTRAPARCAARSDAALSSPSGQGVAVDGDGRAVGACRRGRRAGGAGRRPARRGGLRRSWDGCRETSR
jgi:osmoprotectant transport system ATP-binding protein